MAAVSVNRGTLSGGGWIRKKERLAVYLRDGFMCLYCGEDLRLVPDHGRTLDHIRCRSRGGSNRASNLITACRSCNSARADLTIKDFADEETLKRIRRHTRRKMRRYRAQALELVQERREQLNVLVPEAFSTA